MSYIYLLLTVFSNGAKGYSSKLVGKYIDSSLDNAKLNAIRAPLCAIISLLILTFRNELSHLSSGGIYIAILAGIAMALFQMSWISSVKNGAYMMVGAFGTASFIIPLLFGVLFLKESFGIKKLLAVIFIAIAVYFMCCYNLKIKGKFTKKTFLLLVSVTVFQGVAQFLQKFYTAEVEKANATVYNFYMFVSMSVFLLLYMCFCLVKGQDNKPLQSAVYLHIVLMSVALFVMSYSQTLAAKTMDASVLYPLINIASLFLNFFMSTVLFKEKVKKENLIGVAAIITAIILYL